MTKPLIRSAMAMAALSFAAFLAGCLSSTAVQPSLLDVRGEWSYAGAQSGANPESLSGTLVISTESGTAFQGRLDVFGVSQQSGQSRLLAGLVSGVVAANGVIDFDASVEATPRRHVGRIVADTITGTWVGHSADGVMTTGTFRTERETR